MIAPSLETLRVFLHVLAATVWVGGQLTLAALVPALRRHDGAITRVAARAFNRIAWPAFAVLVVTGVWNVAAERHEAEGEYRTTVLVKIAVALVSGLTAYLHSRATTPRGLAAYGALTGISALAALFLGVLLHS